MAEQVVKLEDVLCQNTVASEKENKPDVKKKRRKSKSKKKTESDVPRGMAKSGRPWKTQKKRFSSIIKTRGYKLANKFEKLLANKNEINKNKNLTKAIVDERNQQIQAKKERKRLNLQRQEENRLKAEIVQVIKNPAKLKRLRKKQLRLIEKRDTLKK